MKKLSLLATSLLLAICLTGCGNESKAANITSHKVNENESGIILLCAHTYGSPSNDGYEIKFFLDSYTDTVWVSYFEKHGYGGGGTYTPYYNEDGKIMTYAEFKRVHKH